MLLEESFYFVHKIVEKGSGSYKIAISLNKEHAIIQAHFPGNPVTPGACMIQIVKELIQEILGFDVFMQSASNVKFTALINPYVHEDLVLNLEIDTLDFKNIKVKTTVYFEDVLALKMSSIYTKLDA